MPARPSDYLTLGFEPTFNRLMYYAKEENVKMWDKKEKSTGIHSFTATIGATAAIVPLELLAAAENALKLPLVATSTVLFEIPLATVGYTVRWLGGESFGQALIDMQKGMPGLVDLLYTMYKVVGLVLGAVATLTIGLISTYLNYGLHEKLKLINPDLQPAAKTVKVSVPVPCEHEKEIQELNRQLLVKKTEIEKNQENIQKLTALENQIKSKEDEIAKLKKLESDITSLREQIKTLESSKENLEKQLKEFQAQPNEKTKITELEEQIAKLKKQLEDKGTTPAAPSATPDPDLVAKLQGQIAELEKQKNALESKPEAEVQKRIQKLEEKLAEANSQLEGIKLELEAKTLEASETARLGKEKDATIDVQNTLVKEQDALLKQLQADIEKLTQEKADLEKKVPAASTLGGNFAPPPPRVDLFAATMEKRFTTTAAAATHAEELQKAAEAKGAAEAALANALEAARKQEAELNKQKEDLASKIEELKKDHLTAIQVETAKYTNAVAAFKSSCKDLFGQLYNITKSSNASLEEEMRIDQEFEQKEITDQIVELKTMLTKVDGLFNAAASLNVDQLTEQKEESLRQIELSRQEIQTATAAAEALKSKVAALQEQFDEHVTAKAAEAEEQEGKLQKKDELLSKTKTELQESVTDLKALIEEFNEAKAKHTEENKQKAKQDAQKQKAFEDLKSRFDALDALNKELQPKAENTGVLEKQLREAKERATKAEAERATVEENATKHIERLQEDKRTLTAANEALASQLAQVAPQNGNGSHS